MEKEGCALHQSQRKGMRLSHGLKHVLGSKKEQKQRRKWQEIKKQKGGKPYC